MNAFPPMISPRFQVSAEGVLQYKPYPSYPSWLDAWDVGALVPADVQSQIDDINEAIAALDATDESLAALIGAVGTLADSAATAAASAQSDATQALSDAAAAQSTADDALAAAGGAANVYPTHHTITPNQFHTIAGGFGSANFASTIWLSTYWLMTGLNAEVDLTLLLEAGNYEIKMLWTRGSSAGDLTLRLDGTNLGTKVGYNASNLNAEETWTVSGVAAGSHTLNLKVNAKQGASSGYNISASLFTVRKT